MNPLHLLSTLLLPTLTLAQSSAATFTCPADSNKNATILAGTQPYTYNIQCDTHYLGDEITRFYTADGLKACAEACSNHQWEEKPCRSATIVKTTSTCILRSSVGEIAQRPYVECAVLQ